jgi:hypothetical protein
LGADMKTRQELILDFMLALASNPSIVKPFNHEDEITPNYYDVFSSDLYSFAAEMSDVYLNNGELK